MQQQCQHDQCNTCHSSYQCASHHCQPPYPYGIRKITLRQRKAANPRRRYNDQRRRRDQAGIHCRRAHYQSANNTDSLSKILRQMEPRLLQQFKSHQ